MGRNPARGAPGARPSWAKLAGAGAPDSNASAIAIRSKYRRDMFKSTAAMIAERPFSGYGLGTYATVYPRFARFESGASVDHANNDW